MLPSSPFAFNLSKHQGLSQWTDSLHQVAKVLEIHLHHQSFQWFQGWFTLGLTGLISLQSKGLSRVFSSTTVQFFKVPILRLLAFFMVQLSHLYMTTEKIIALTRWTFVDKIMALLFNMLSRFVTTFLPRNKGLLISWLQSLSAVILEPKKRKSVTASTFSPSFSPFFFAMKWWD